MDKNDPTIVAEPTEQLLTVDDILNIPEELLPLNEDGSNHTGLDPLETWLPNLPIDVRKHIANIRGNYTKKTQELARERDTLRSELAAERAALLAERETLYNGPAAKAAATLAADQTVHDVFDQEGMMKELERQAAAQYTKMLQPIQAELEQKRAEASAKAFVDAHPDLHEPEMKKEVAAILLQREDVSLEDAYYIARGKVSSLKAKELAAQQAEVKASAEAMKAKQRDVFSKTSTGTPGATQYQARRGVDAWDVYQNAKAEEERRRR